MNKQQFYLSTIDSKAAELARELGLGLELAQFCTASNMDEAFPSVSQEVEQQLTGISRRLLHGPFNELFPCAIDPKARALAAERYRQALALAQKYRAQKVILHAGFQPHIYFPIWFVEQSVVFWKRFLTEWDGQQTIVLENVMETDPQWLLEIVEQVNDPRLRLCLDVGHAQVYSKVPVSQWISTLSPYLSHFHLHNNPGDADLHAPLFRGVIPMEAVLEQLEQECPEATCTIEVMDNTDNLPFLKNLTNEKSDVKT